MRKQFASEIYCVVLLALMTMEEVLLNEFDVQVTVHRDKFLQ